MFKNPDNALRWAASVKYREIVDGPSINRMLASPQYASLQELTYGLTRQEAQLQSELIFKHVYSMSDKAHQQYILAKYLYKNEINDLIQRALSGLLYSGGVHRRDITKLVLAYCGARVSKSELRKSLHCEMGKVKLLEKQVYDVMDKIHYRVMSELETSMIEAGLVQGSYEAVCS